MSMILNEAPKNQKFADWKSGKIVSLADEATDSVELSFPPVQRFTVGKGYKQKVMYRVPVIDRWQIESEGRFSGDDDKITATLSTKEETTLENIDESSLLDKVHTEAIIETSGAYLTTKLIDRQYSFPKYVVPEGKLYVNIENHMGLAYSFWTRIYFHMESVDEEQLAMKTLVAF
jgi:hypothetical protein